MKALFRISLLITALTLASFSCLQAQKIIKGTVYREGKPAAGVFVEVHNGGTTTTNFEGKYEVEAADDSRYLRFRFQKESQKLSISGETGNVIDFAFDGEMPGDKNLSDTQDEAVLKTHDELLAGQDEEYMSESSLYLEFYKLNYFEVALPYWKNVFRKYPKSSINVYIHGINMYENFIKNAKTPEERDKYIDELMNIYNQKINYFNEKGSVLGRKATAWLNYKLKTENPPEGDALKKILKRGYSWLNESVTEENTDLSALGLFMQTTKSLFLLGELPKETVIKNYDILNNKIDRLMADSQDEELTKNAVAVKNYIENIFDSSGAADCETLVNIFSPRFKEKNSDIEFIKSMLRRLGNAKCDESSLFYEASERLYELEPSPEAAFNMARRYVKMDQAGRAKDYYKQAMEQETDNDLLADYYYEYAYFVFAKENALQESRSYALKALDLNPVLCQALMLIGDIYAAASQGFGNDDFEKSAVFWLAVDYFERARQEGYDCSVDAVQKISTYRKYFPGKEETFFQGLQEGQTYKLEGWINESTKVRF
jgi:hypothetical protein